jgi:hypothetical protein
LFRNLPKGGGGACLKIGQLEGGACLEIGQLDGFKQAPGCGKSYFAVKRYRTPCLVLVVVLTHIFYGSHMRTRVACGTVSFECGGSTVLYKDTDTALVRH